MRKITFTLCALAIVAACIAQSNALNKINQDQKIKKSVNHQDDPLIIDDFEISEVTYKKWSNPMESGTMKSSIDISDSAQSGKKGAKISFTGTKSPGSWTNLQCKTSIPSNKNKISFWAKAEKECFVKATIYQGLYHDKLEVFSTTISLSTSWKKYSLDISTYKDLVFSHPLQNGGKASDKITKEDVTAIGFAEMGLPLVFYIDDLRLD